MLAYRTQLAKTGPIAELIPNKRLTTSRHDGPLLLLEREEGQMGFSLFWMSGAARNITWAYQLRAFASRTSVAMSIFCRILAK